MLPKGATNLRPTFSRDKCVHNGNRCDGEPRAIRDVGACGKRPAERTEQVVDHAPIVCKPLCGGALTRQCCSRLKAFDRRHKAIAASHDGGDIPTAAPAFAQRST